MDEVLIKDLRVLYGESLILYKGSLCFVRTVDDDDFILHNLATNKQLVVKFDKTLFSSPRNRIGMVNISNNAVFIARRTIRQYSIGITVGNSKFYKLRTKYTVPYNDLALHLSSLQHACIQQAYDNIYPTLEKALELLKDQKSGSVAFDKQFAVDYLGAVHYKQLCVGEVVNGKIIFLNEYKYLNSLLENGYEKTTGTFRATPIRRISGD